jgi:kelch-like protein 17 (actinfilin)/kelch-like protein 20
VEYYEASTNVWTAAAPMRVARNKAGAAVLNGRLYVAGGSSGNTVTSNHLRSVERYDPSTNSWETVAPMSTTRRGFVVAELDGKLYAVGGIVEGGSTDSVERYDPATNAWEPVAPMQQVRQYLSAAVLDGKLYVAGGINEGKLASVERYDPSTNVWEAVTSMTTGRAAFFLYSSE